MCWWVRVIVWGFRTIILFFLNLTERFIYLYNKYKGELKMRINGENMKEDYGIVKIRNFLDPHRDYELNHINGGIKNVLGKRRWI